MNILRNFLSIFLSFTLVSSVFAQSDQQIIFDAPAKSFTESVPLGNGQLGAMVFGDPFHERIIINEKTMWSGGVQNPNREDASMYLPQIQQFLREGRNREAQNLLQTHFVCAGPGSGHGAGANVKFGCYQIFADLFIDWKDTAKAVTSYKRVLQLDKALSITEWTTNGIAFTEEVLCSAPQKAIIIRLTANKANALNFTLTLNRKEHSQTKVDNNALSLAGQLPAGTDKGIRFSGYVKANTKDGKQIVSDNALIVSSASECIIVISAATDFNWPAVEQRGPDPLPIVKKRVQAAIELPWATIVKNHIADFQSLYNRCQFQLGAPEKQDVSNFSTRERLVRFEKGETDISLPALYFNFGRYLLISSSRPGGLPANLQGLWAEEYQTPWNGDYHLNINIQMNYWPAEVTNLASCHEPLIEFTKQLTGPGSKTAKAYYNSDGWVAHVISNPWKFTAPGEGAGWGSTLTGGAWLCEHLWQHYLYNPKKETLQEIYPVLKEASIFYRNILIEDPTTKWLVTAPSNSPENTYKTDDGFTGQITMGPTMDMQIGRELIGNTIAAAKLLGVDAEFSSSLREIKERLAPNQISRKTGIVQEWIRDYDETDPNHRHVSQLYGLYPFYEINKTDAPQLMDAARKTLERRGDDGTGWSRAWKINFWARLGDGDRALKVLKGLLVPVVNDKAVTYSGKGAGTYSNLFCAHPPFQIDGNFGATAGIAEMLLQSREGIIELLPALPNDWKDGQISGICARGGYEVNMKWVAGKLVTCAVLSKYGGQCEIKYESAIVKLNTKPGITYNITEQLVR
ncbi:MAG: glycoside hydrolase family 95 protein [Cyclobacteriaceae bacterium]